MSKKSPRTALEEKKLRAEIRKTQAEADLAELKRNDLARKEEQFNHSDYSAHTYTFYADVDEESVGACISELSYWMRSDPRCDVNIVLNSPGGYCVDGLALYDFLREMRRKGHTVTISVLGEASSMGAVLLQAADKRIMGRNAYFLIHEPATGKIGKASAIKDTAEWAQSLWDRLAELLAERSKLTKAEVKERADRKDWIMWAQEAKRNGFCDSVR